MTKNPEKLVHVDRESEHAQDGVIHEARCVVVGLESIKAHDVAMQEIVGYGIEEDSRMQRRDSEAS